MSNSNMEEFRRRALEKLNSELGPVIRGFLADPAVIEIMLNPSGELWVERLGYPMQEFGYMPPTQAESLMNSIASALNLQLTAQNPILECELPRDGSRFEGIIPPVVSAPVFTIRKKAIMVFTLDDYVKKGIMSQAQKEAIEDAVRDRKNIVIVGGTGTGKTTLTNAVIRYMVDASPNDRLVILEDTMELQCSAKNSVLLRSVQQANMTQLLKATMRLRPDRIIVGEVRDGAALDLLKAWNTGHPGGVATIHANSAMEGLTRMEDLVEEATSAAKQRLIAAAVDLIVFIEKHAGSRRIKEILRVTGYEQQYLTQPIGEQNV